MSAPRGYHDIGGLPGGPIDPSHGGEQPWEKLSVALSNVLGLQGRGLISVHEVRRAREELGADLYDRLGYFEKGAQVTANLLVEKGILTREEIEERMRRIRARREGGAR